METLGASGQSNQRVYWLLLSIASVIALLALSWGVWRTDQIADSTQERSDLLRDELAK